MINWHKYPSIRLLIPLILGIIAGSYAFLLISKTSLLIGLSSLIILFIILQLLKFSYKRTFIQNTIGVSCVFLFGIFLNFNTNSTTILSNDKTNYVIELEQLDEKNKVFQGIGTIIQKEDSLLQSHQKVYLSIAKDSLININQFSNKILLTRLQLQSIESIGNPNTFNFNDYLKGQNIAYTAYVKPVFIEIIDEQQSVLQPIYDLRTTLVQKIDQNIETNRSASILKALILGYKKDLDTDTKAVYSETGAMHVLAVSGLHIGIILLLIRFLFKQVKRKIDINRWTECLITIGILIFYAILAGLSPSILRATLMFSLIAIGLCLKRHSYIINTIGGSAFILLMFKPGLLYDIGFQLSYAALTGIILLQPIIYKKLIFKHKIIDGIWALFTVSLAAQITTLPFSLYYFHQFPTYFFISNWLVIPAVTILIPFGFILLFLPNIIAQYVGFVIDFLLNLLFKSLEILSNLPFSTITGLFIEPIELFLLLIVVGLLIAIVLEPKKKLFFAFGIMILFTFSIHQYIKIDKYFEQQIVFYDDYKNSIVSSINYQKATHYYLTNQQEKPNYISDNELFYNTNEIDEIQAEDLVQLYDKQLFNLTDSTDLSYNYTIDYLYINSNNYKNIEKVLKNYKYSKIIISSTVKYWIKEKIVHFCSENVIDYHDLKQKGHLAIKI